MESWRAPTIPDLPGQGPETKIADTAAGELMAAAAGPAATLYACGITPYDATHIGHAATYIAWDLLIRAWLDAGHTVTYVQNVTDVDDPLLERAARDGEDWRDLAEREIARFRGDMEALRVLPPDHYVGAVEALPIIERLGRRLGQHGALYDLDGDVYLARSADPSFGTVTGLDPATMIVLFGENGGDPERPGKKDPLDPLVWLAERPGEPAWPSGFGRGRPGWHVECAAIATEYLGTTFDVQAGGTDLAFPHHEMSASHARVAFGGVSGPARPAFARRYAHAGMVRLDGEKMSKSLGNLVFVSALIAGGVDPMALRLAILAHHYREDWDWTDAGLAGAQDRLARWRAALVAASAMPPARGGPGAPAESVLDAVRERLADDLDAPGALAVVDRWADAALARPGSSDAGLVRDTIDALLGVALLPTSRPCRRPSRRRRQRVASGAWRSGLPVTHRAGRT
jgi:L-cysteine:1D-myo-inositol 2-amino-2-deoxy-alpha-D-glucopyranoside ligase